MTYEVLMLLSAMVTAAGGIGFVLVMLKTYKGQMNAQIFTTLNQRYDDILKDFPEEAWDSRFNLDTVLPPPSRKLTFCAFRYFNLCSEEFYLYKRGYIRREVWEIWQGVMHSTLRSPLFRREWQVLSSEFRSYPEFFHHVEDVQNNERPGDPRKQEVEAL